MSSSLTTFTTAVSAFFTESVSAVSLEVAMLSLSGFDCFKNLYRSFSCLLAETSFASFFFCVSQPDTYFLPTSLDLLGNFLSITTKHKHNKMNEMKT